VYAMLTCAWLLETIESFVFEPSAGVY
jgi:hypothetical protein